MAAEDLAAAIALCEKVVAQESPGVFYHLDPDPYVAHRLLLARLYRAAGHPADARRVLEEAVTILDERNREPIYSMRVPAHRGIDCPAALTYEQILALRAAD